MSETTAPEKIIINGLEYSPEDATRYIELGRGREELESKLNTSLDKVYPEFTRTSQRNKELEESLRQRDEELSAFKKAQEEAKIKANTPDEVTKAREAARSLGLADENFLKEKGYMTRADLDAYYAEREKQQQSVQIILNQAQTLEKEIDGSDGRVPFDQRGVLAYARAYGINDLKEAYEQMNERGNAKWKEAQVKANERPGLTTITAGGRKNPPTPKMTGDNFSNAVSEWVEQIQQAQK